MSDEKIMSSPLKFSTLTPAEPPGAGLLQRGAPGGPQPSRPPLSLERVRTLVLLTNTQLILLLLTFSFALKLIILFQYLNEKTKEQACCFPPLFTPSLLYSLLYSLLCFKAADVQRTKIS